jgi:hypothetical protein
MQLHPLFQYLDYHWRRKFDSDTKRGHKISHLSKDFAAIPPIGTLRVHDGNQDHMEVTNKDSIKVTVSMRSKL